MDKNNKAKLVKIAFCPSNNTLTIWEKHRFKIKNILDSPYIFKNTSERGRATYYKKGAISLIYNEESWVDNIGILPNNLPLSKEAVLDFLQISNEDVEIKEKVSIEIIFQNIHIIATPKDYKSRKVRQFIISEIDNYEY